MQYTTAKICSVNSNSMQRVYKINSMYFDAHTHLNLDPLHEDWLKYDTLFKQSGWLWLACIWTTPENSITALQIAQDSSCEYAIATAWVHPYEIGRTYITTQDVDRAVQECEHLIKHYPKHIRAVWECWIDAHYDWYANTKELQLYALRQQCELAHSHSLPVVVHSRDDFEATLQVVKDYQDIDRYIHCWSYPAEYLQELTNNLDHVRIGICGHVTYDKTWYVEASTKKARLDSKISMLIETDAPYLTPVPHRGELNHPAMITHTYRHCSGLLWVELELLQQVVAENRKRLYCSPHWAV